MSAEARSAVEAALADLGVALEAEVTLTLRHGGKVTGRVVDARVRAVPNPFGAPRNVELIAVTVHRTGAGVASDRARAVVPWHAIDLVEPTAGSTHPAL